MGAFVTRTVGDVVAELRMSRSNFPGTLLVLEGPSDSKFWYPRTISDECQIVIGGSKPTVTGAVIGSGDAGTLGIVDDDYDSLVGVTLPSPNTFRTDCRDLEGMLLRSAALERVLHEVGDPGKIASFEQSEGRSVRRALLDRALLFGNLRLLDRLRAWKFDFDALSPYRFIDIATWSLDTAGVLQVVSTAVGVAIADLELELSRLPNHEDFTVAHGRDTLAILAVGLRMRLGSTQHSVERVCQMLRLAYSADDARASRLFEELGQWERANQPYRLLRS